MAAIRALIIASVSFEMVISPSRTCLASSPIMSRATSRPAGSFHRPWSRIFSSSACPSTPSVRVSAAPAPWLSVFLFIASLLALVGFHFYAGRRANFLQCVGVADDILEQFFQLVVAVKLVHEVGQPPARFESLAQGFNLVHDVFRLKVFDAAEVQLDTE